MNKLLLELNSYPTSAYSYWPTVFYGAIYDIITIFKRSELCYLPLEVIVQKFPSSFIYQRYTMQREAQISQSGLKKIKM